MVRYKFSKTENKTFEVVLRKRIKAYFTDRNLSSRGNTQMKIKTLVALSFYFVPFFIILSSGIDESLILFMLWITMGFGKAFIGVSVMHDALHGSYSEDKAVNTFMNFSALVVGAYPKTWKVQHNILHHTYTNIEHADEDISPLGVLRFSPNQKLRWFHKYQHIYVVFFYSILTLVWALFKDFVKIYKYRRENLIKPGKEFRKHFALIFLSKVLYFSVFLILPIVVLPIPVWSVLLMFLSMHMVAGFVLSMIFQLAHIMPTTEFYMQDEQLIEENWLVHQLLTTSNYAMDNKVLSWFIGGLNFQVEHHLFPKICHIHYPAISKIVQETTREFNIPYHFEDNVFKAISVHFKMLKTLGQA